MRVEFLGHAEKPRFRQLKTYNNESCEAGESNEESYRVTENHAFILLLFFYMAKLILFTRRRDYKKTHNHRNLFFFKE